MVAILCAMVTLLPKSNSQFSPEVVDGDVELVDLERAKCGD